MRTQEEARAEALKMVPAMLEGVKSALMKDSTPATVDTLQTVLWVLGEAYRLSGVVVPMTNRSTIACGVPVFFLRSIRG